MSGGASGSSDVPHSQQPTTPPGAGSQPTPPPSGRGAQGPSDHLHGTTTPSPRTGGAGSGARLAAGTAVSRYRIESVLGEGGMGVVYLARQERPDRQVALKVIRPGFANARMLRRFEQEAEVLGRLLHPGIAQIYEAGTADAGYGPQPFFAMELVRGVPLTQYASEKELSTHQRLELMTKVCDAVEHAHQKGVIHRDLKPGNILVTEDGQPKILDFGVARATDSDLQQTTLQTDVGQLIGTIPYMSPEQVGGDPSELDTRSDVYALGVILFELLAGRLPYSLERRMIHEAARVIREEEPTRLSSINRTLRGDVETIVSHALEKEKSRRYQTASALGADIRRYLADEPITARPASTWYQLRKFSRRNRALVGGVAATFVVLILGLIVSLYAFAEARYQSGLKDSALGLARENETIAKDEAERARLAQEAEKERADELDKVAKFQAAQFEGLDTQLMGIRLRQEMIADALSAMEKAKLPAEEVAAAKEQLEQTLARGNPTNVALKSLYDNIFAPALKAVDEQFADQPLVRAQLLQTIADTLSDLGLLEESLAPQEEALSIHRQELGDEHPHTLNSMNNLGWLLGMQGKRAEAEPYTRTALEASRRVLGDRHSETLTIVSNMGAALAAEGKFAEAERFYLEALEGFRETLGDDYWRTLLLKRNLGTALQEQGRLAEAEPYFREAWEGSRRVIGEEHPNTLQAAGAIAGLLRAQGRFDESEKLYRDTLEKWKRLLGDMHPHTLATLNELGMVLYAQQKYAEAEPLFRLARETAMRSLGPDHITTQNATSNLGGSLAGQGKFDEAEPFYLEAMAAARRILGDDHPSTVTSISNMGVLREAQGRVEDAESYYREALERTKRISGEHHPHAIVTAYNLAVLLWRQGKLADAEPFAREAVEGCRTTYPDDHPDLLRTITLLGVILQAQGNFADSEPLLREVLEIQTRTRGREHWETAVTMGSLARALSGLNRHQEAEELLIEVEQIYRTAAGVPPGRYQRGLEALVAMYTFWHAAEPDKGYDAKAAQWRARLEELQASTRPSVSASSRPGTGPAN